MRHLPDSFALGIARGMVGLLLLVKRRLKEVGMRNLELVFPEKSESERKTILQSSFEILAHNLLSFCRARLLTPESSRNLLDYSAQYAVIDAARARAPRKGILFASAHYGLFEYSLQLYALLVRPGAVLARGLGLPRLDAWFKKEREQFGNVVFDRKGGYKEIMEHLNRGKDVVALFDQNVKANHAVFVDFFGIPAATTKALAIAALRTGAPIVLAVTREAGFLQPEVIMDYLVFPEDVHGTREEKIAVITRIYHERLEQVIRKYPENWFWIHRRFKTRPPGELESIYSPFR